MRPFALGLSGQQEDDSWQAHDGRKRPVGKTPKAVINVLVKRRCLITVYSMTQIILLNGVGSAGKSSIAKALQALSSKPFLHVQMDTFLEMLPTAYGDHPDAWTYRPVPDSAKPEIAISEGPLGRRLLQGMRHAVRALAVQGLDLIVDDVLMGRSDHGVSEYDELLSEFSVFRVGVFASLETLEMRENQRGDRLLGLARWQFDRVHSGMEYDFEVQTDTVSPAAIAAAICKKFGIQTR